MQEPINGESLGSEYFLKARYKTIGGTSMLILGGLGAVANAYLLRKIPHLNIIATLGTLAFAKHGFDLIMDAKGDREYCRTLDELVMHGSSDGILDLSTTDFLSIVKNSRMLPIPEDATSAVIELPRRDYKIK